MATSSAVQAYAGQGEFLSEPLPGAVRTNDSAGYPVLPDVARTDDLVPAIHPVVGASVVRGEGRSGDLVAVGRDFRSATGHGFPWASDAPVVPAVVVPQGRLLPVEPLPADPVVAEAKDEKLSAPRSFVVASASDAMAVRAAEQLALQPLVALLEPLEQAASAALAAARRREMPRQELP